MLETIAVLLAVIVVLLALILLELKEARKPVNNYFDSPSPKALKAKRRTLGGPY